MSKVNEIFYIDDDNIQHVFFNMEDFLKYLKDTDYDYYLFVLEQVCTADDYDGKDYGTALCKEIER